jgi:hypothetical protein
VLVIGTGSLSWRADQLGLTCQPAGYFFGFCRDQLQSKGIAESSA